MHSLNEDPGVTELVRLALAEDDVNDDVTSAALVPDTARAQARLIARADGVVAGLVLLEDQAPLRVAFPQIDVEVIAADGDRVAPGDVIAALSGSAHEVLGLERTLLNFLQRLSGIATTTARFVDAARGTRARIQETRKTAPGFRLLDKYAVSCGGGVNHRISLADQVLIKENHLVFAGAARSPEAVAEGIRRARSHAPEGMPIEVEVEDLAQFDAAPAARPDIVMLDDFTDDDVREAVLRRDRTGPPPPLIEVSGGVKLERVRTLACLGVDRISVGALTHSVEALDLALDVEPAP
ncbi:MAG: nicotinate-nucleotide diphosphorylase (carboxylating) [Planctomycetes bacterium]|nr:nicotinate-nucleotide diphosphorylase (carboxylating) [Planctomycetota bacterium]